MGFNMDNELYLKKQIEQEESHEEVCLRCGACCGINDGDPCANLEKDGLNTYNCKSYDDRLGAQKTVSGRDFTCVMIRDVLKFESPYPECAYSKNKLC